VLGGRRHVGSPLQRAKAPCRPRRGPSSRQHKSAGTRSPILGRAKSTDPEPCRTQHLRELLRPSRVLAVERGDADRLAVVSGLVRAGFFLCPQRDSNPRCRLESAKLGISRRLPRSFAIDRNLLPLGQTARSGIVGSLQRFPRFVEACVVHAPSILV
jgi:hypothetical protein